MVAGVDGSVVVGIREELDDIERATVLGEYGLAGLSGQLKGDFRRRGDRNRGRRARGNQWDRLERGSSVGGERGAHVLDRARDRDVHEPAPVWRDRGTRHIPIEE